MKNHGNRRRTVYPSQGRFWLTIAGVSLACCTSCNQPPQKTTLGNLPGQPPGELEPKLNATTYFAHGHLLERQGQFERAAVQYRKAIALRPDFLSARNRLGITLNKLGRHAEASDQFKQAIANQPQLAYLHNNLGFSLYLENKPAEAEAALEQALNLKPDFPRAHLNYALVLARLGHFDDAFSQLMEVGSEADARFNMGILLTEAGKYADAARYLESALALKPDLDAARQQLREVSRLAAEAEARQAVQLASAAEPTTENATPEDDAGATAPESPGTAVAEATTEEVMPEPVVTSVADAKSEVTAVEPTQTVVADAAGEDATPELALAAEVDAAATDQMVAKSAPLPLLPANESEWPHWAQEADTDWEFLFALINEALTALKNQSDDLETLWCQVSYYLFPETAPDEPVSAPDAATEDQGAFPENMPEEWILDWPY
jgi:Flp pilus assembly protein TadD